MPQLPHLTQQTVEYKDQTLHPVLDDNSQWYLTQEDVLKGFKTSKLQLEHILESNASVIQEGKHYLNASADEPKSQLWNKKGLMKLGFFLDNVDSVNFLEFLEDLDFKQKSPLSTTNLVNIYKSLEKKMVALAQESEDKEVSPEEMTQMVSLFNHLVQTHNNLVGLERQESARHTPASPKGFLEQLSQNGYKLADQTAAYAHDFASKTRDTAYNFARKTEDDAFKFTTKTEDDAFKFTENTRDAAYNFASKTEDDAFKFATKMEDDAYHFVDKMAENAYQFASKGMDYGYMFTTQGEELGPMADRILWMASEIGLMADRIGEMADRIVHTEHLIVNTSVLILNFGLLIDGTIKTLAEAGLNALALTFDREAPTLHSSTKHLEIINQNVQQIISQQHEYDLKVLEQQKELRKATLSALDYIKYEY